jgi:CRP-like cAMP-binding protein
MRPDFEVREVTEGELEFLSECDVFLNLDNDLVQRILARGEVVTLPAGAKLFDIGQPPDRFFVIKSGVVEICRPSADRHNEMHPVAYLGTSDSMGEMTLITGSSHGSMARLPEGGEIFQIRREEFLCLIDDYPIFTKNLMLLFAQRLESRVKDMRIAKRHLHGSLRVFDLPTVIQTIIASKLTGTLVITNEQQVPTAEVNFDHGQVRSAFLEDLLGAEAFMQLFQPPPQDGSFDFKTGPIQNVGDSRFEIHIPTMNLLMESMRLQDELNEMKKLVKDDDLFIPMTSELNWDADDPIYPLALQIWLVLNDNPYTVAELRSSTLRCHYYCYSVLYHLLETHQIGRSERSLES